MPAPGTPTQRIAIEPPRRAWSLRSRLTWLATLTTLIAWLTGGAGALIAAYQEGEKLYDEQLRDVAHVVLSFANHEIDEIRQDGRTDMVHEETAATLDPRYAYQIWSKDGELLLLSHNASRKPYAPLTQEGMLRPRHRWPTLLHLLVAQRRRFHADSGRGR